VKMFQSGRTSVVNEDRSSRPTTSRAADSVERVNALVQEDRQLTDTDIADKLDIICRSAYSIILEDLGYHNICVRWVPSQFTNEHEPVSVEMKTQFL